MVAWQTMVRQFLAKIGSPRGLRRPELRDAELRARLIAEEAAETVVGLVGSTKAVAILGEFRDRASQGDRGSGVLLRPDLVEAIDGLCDLVYVVLGTAEAIGIDLDQFFGLVHAANMNKTADAVDGHGKRGRKPAGWMDPKEAIRAELAYLEATSGDRWEREEAAARGGGGDRVL